MESIHGTGTNADAIYALTTLYCPPMLPFYPPGYPYPPQTHPTTGPPVNEQRYRSPSDDAGSVEYPSISEFLAELDSTSRGHHHFMTYFSSFSEAGYYHIDQLADASLTPEHMIDIIPNLRDGTARAIKKQALEKVRQIKGKGKVN